MNLQLNAEWTDDCQGKKDYDGDIVSISTRYWPGRDGTGYSIEITQDGAREVPSTLPTTKPSAKSSLVLWTKDEYGETSDIDLAVKEFEADTEEEVKAQVEEWAKEQYDRLISILKNAYPIK